MKRIFLCAIFCFLLFCNVAVAKYYSFPFIGRWQPSENPLLIDDYGFQDIQNLRKKGNLLKGISGHTKINTSVLTNYQDYSTDYTEVDSPGRLAVAANTLTVAALDTDEEVYLYRDYAADYFDEDIYYRLDIQRTGTTASAACGFWAVANDLDDLTGLASNDNDHLAVFMESDETGSTLIINGDMELDANWSAYGSPTVNSRSAAQAHGGTSSRLFTSDSAGDGIKGDVFATTTNVIYSISLWVYPDDTTTVTVTIRKGDASGDAYDTQHTGLVQDSWNEITFTYTEEAGGANAYIAVHDGAGTTGNWYVDDVVLKATQNVLWLRETNGAVDTTDSCTTLLLNTDYYLTIERDEAEGTYGRLTCKIYSDSTRVVLIDTLTVTLTEKQDFRYLYGMLACNNGTGGTAWAGTIKNLNDYSQSAVRTAFHFNKEQPQESHIIVRAYDSDEDTYLVLTNDTAIPDAGNFNPTVLHADATGATQGRFAEAPQSNIIYCNGVESMIWGGDEQPCTTFITSTATVTSNATKPREYTTKVRNTLDSPDQVAIIGGGNDANVKLLLHADGTDASTTFTDDSTSAHTLTAVGDAQLDVAQAKFGSASGLFDGTGDYLTIPDHADWAMGTGLLTIEAQVRFNSVSATQVIFSHTTDVDNYVELKYDQSAGTLYFKAVVGAATVIEVSGVWTPLTKTWYHIALIRGWSGNADDWAITVDGAAIATSTDSSEWPDLTGLFTIGQYDTGSYFNGWIDEFRLSKGVTRFTSNFDVPIAGYYGTGAMYWLVGFTRPLQGVKFYLSKTNPQTGTLAVTEWNGYSWETISVTDNTSGLSSTGTVTWTSTEETSLPKYIDGYQRYWYQFALSAGEAEIYYVTVDAPFQTIKNLWDGSSSICVNFKKYDGTTWIDYSDEVNDLLSTTVAVLDSMDPAHYIYAGFLEKQQGFEIFLPAGMENSTANTTMTVSRWNGDTWQEVNGLVDGTEEGGVSLAKSGMVSFLPSDVSEEFTSGDDGLFYYYKIQFDEILDTETEIFYVSGVPVTKELVPYNFSAMFSGRSFLFSEVNGEKNKCIYSVYNNADIWNGPDAGSFTFGGNSEITAAGRIYNVYRTAGLEQLLVFKKHETYRLYSEGSSWQLQQLSSNIGCIAPYSLAVCEVAELATEQRHVAIFQAAQGIFLCDGAIIQSISDDIRCYWDTNDSRCIPADRIDASVAVYDPNIHAYKILISSGAGQATHNVELEYSLKNKEWIKIYREDANEQTPLQFVFGVRDTYGQSYAYGTTDEGYLIRLENGNTFEGTPITQYVHTKNILLDDEAPYFWHTVINHFRLSFTDKATGATEDISFEHYCDDALTVDGVNSQFLITDIDMDDGPHEKRDCTLGGCLGHSLKISATTSIDNGMELTGMGIIFTSDKTIR